jgi:hypothetical protein
MNKKNKLKELWNRKDIPIVLTIVIIISTSIFLIINNEKEKNYNTTQIKNIWNILIWVQSLINNILKK